jgi:uncharacterized protein
MGMAEELEKLHQLHRDGAMTDAEFEAAKASLLRRNQGFDEKVGHAVRQMVPDENSWGMFIHLSQFCGYLLPFAGLIVPIVIWQVKKNESVVIDEHGRNVVNWIISAFIYGVVCALLCLVLIGFLLGAILAILCIVFPIIGAIKANQGEVWPYPGAIRFF